MSYKHTAFTLPFDGKENLLFRKDFFKKFDLKDTEHGAQNWALKENVMQEFIKGRPVVAIEFGGKFIIYDEWETYLGTIQKEEIK